MFRLDKLFEHIKNLLSKEAFWWTLPLSLLVLAIVLSYLMGFSFQPLPMILSIILIWVVRNVFAWRVTAGFVRSLYGLESTAQAKEFLYYRMYGRSEFKPYLIIKEAKIAFGDDLVRNIGGPGGLVVYNDTAVVTEQAGRLKRVILGPGFPNLEPFEKVWDMIDLRPQRWVFDVSAVTHDGIPIHYDTDIRFQVNKTEEDVFKAATAKWIRDAWRTEPDRLMTWTKLVIISQTEGTARSILARYTLDQLIDADCRNAVKAELQASLGTSAPKIGVKILDVFLGDIKLEGKLLDQWTDAWRAERDRQVNKVVVEGKAKRARILEKARAEVRKKLLDKTVEIFAELDARGQKTSSKLVALSFIEMLKRTSFEQSFYVPNQMVETLDILQQKIERGSVTEK